MVPLLRGRFDFERVVDEKGAGATAPSRVEVWEGTQTEKPCEIFECVLTRIKSTRCTDPVRVAGFFTRKIPVTESLIKKAATSIKYCCGFCGCCIRLLSFFLYHESSVSVLTHKSGDCSFRRRGDIFSVESRFTGDVDSQNSSLER
jgi:hypothetical protein